MLVDFDHLTLSTARFSHLSYDAFDGGFEIRIRGDISAGNIRQDRSRFDVISRHAEGKISRRCGRRDCLLLVHDAGHALNQSRPAGYAPRRYRPLPRDHGRAGRARDARPDRTERYNLLVLLL